MLITLPESTKDYDENLIKTIVKYNSGQLCFCYLFGSLNILQLSHEQDLTMHNSWLENSSDKGASFRYFYNHEEIL